jgi:hypothetical protein
LGFLVPLTEKDDPITHAFCRIGSKNMVLVLFLGQLQSGIIETSKIKEIATSNCWVCEGWSDKKFEFTPGISTDKQIDKETPIYLH